jgi:hypothetical protein
MTPEGKEPIGHRVQEVTDGGLVAVDPDPAPPGQLNDTAQGTGERFEDDTAHGLDLAAVEATVQDRFAAEFVAAVNVVRIRAK